MFFCICCRKKQRELKMKNCATVVKTDSDGTKKYYLNGRLHREDGPAMEYADGSRV